MSLEPSVASTGMQECAFTAYKYKYDCLLTGEFIFWRGMSPLN